MTDITIPPEAVEAAARADYENWRDLYAVRGDTLDWEDIEPQLQNEHRSGVTAAILAALKAWPMRFIEDTDTPWPPRIILPIIKGVHTNHPLSKGLDFIDPLTESDNAEA